MPQRAIYLLFLLTHFFPVHAQTWQWLRQPAAEGTGPRFVQINAVAVDPQGRTVVAGSFAGTITVGPYTLRSEGVPTDIFVAWLDSAGNYVRAVRAGGAQASGQATDLAIAPDGSVTVVGFFQGVNPVFGTHRLDGNNNYLPTNLFIAKLDPNGTWQQAAEAGGTGSTRATAVALRPSGAAVVTGYFTGPSCWFGTSTLSNAGGADAFVAELTPGGSWNPQPIFFGNTGDDRGEDIALLPDGTAVVTGFFTSPSLLIGPATLVNADPRGGSADVFVAELGPGGAWHRAERGGGPGAEQAHNLKLDAHGTAVIAGVFYGPTASFGSFTIQNAIQTSSGDVFVARLSRAGAWSQAVQGGGAGQELVLPNALALGARGEVVLVGSYEQGAARFGAQQLPNAQAPDIFIAWLDSAGTWVKALAVGGGQNEFFPTVALNRGHLTLAGQAQSIGTRFGHWQTTYSGWFVARYGEGKEIKESAASLFIPNILLPDRPGANATFTIKGITSAPWALSVYSRWGTQVYHTVNYQQDWQAQGLSAGVYYYLLTGPAGERVKGWVEVLR